MAAGLGLLLPYCCLHSVSSPFCSFFLDPPSCLIAIGLCLGFQIDKRKKRRFHVLVRRTRIAAPDFLFIFHSSVDENFSPAHRTIPTKTSVKIPPFAESKNELLSRKIPEKAAQNRVGKGSSPLILPKTFLISFFRLEKMGAKKPGSR